MIVPNPQSTAAEHAFQIVGSTTTRSDLASRRELKYTFELADVSKLRRLLEANCQRQVHAEKVSTVRSIYFDDVRLSACQANLNGVGQRQKLRLRWYDSLKPEHDFFFEIKWRRSRVTGKHRLQLRSEKPLWQTSYRELWKRLRLVVPEKQVLAMERFSEPVVTVQYQREHFASKDGTLRVTLDYNLTYFDQLGRTRVSTSFARKLPGLVVLEGKTPLGREHELRRMLFPFTPRVSRCSKYVHGCRLLGHLRHRDS